MNTLNNNLRPTRAAIDWLQGLLQQRLHKALQLTYLPNSSRWLLTFTGSQTILSFAWFPEFFRLGPQPELPCSDWIPHNENFSALEPKLPVPGVDQPLKQLLLHTPNGFYVTYDIPGLIYWLLARCEEVHPPIHLLDAHSRFPSTSSHASQHGYLDRPLVDEWIDILAQLIYRLWPSISTNQHHFQTIVSHDVDAPSAYAFGRRRTVLRQLAHRVIQDYDFSWVLNSPEILRSRSNYLLSEDPFNTFDWLMSQSESAGISSSFYFICGRTHQKLDALYEPEHPIIRSLMRRIFSRGHQIGLHPSYNTFTDPQAFSLEAQRLRQIAALEGIEQSLWGGRMHFLRWQWPITAYCWAQSGFQYDSTLGYADSPGFRCGTCHEYPMFDPIAQVSLNLIQRPLVAMEVSLISKRYLGFGVSQSTFRALKLLQERCRAVRGNFTLLWHNNNLVDSKSRDLYSDVIHSTS